MTTHLGAELRMTEEELRDRREVSALPCLTLYDNFHKLQLHGSLVLRSFESTKTRQKVLIQPCVTKPVFSKLWS